MRYTIALALALFATAVYASCVTNTIITSDGKTLICQTCCYGGSCNTVCF